MKDHHLRALLVVLASVLLLGSLWPAASAQPPSLPAADLPGEEPWVVRAYYDDPQMVAKLAAWLEPWEVHHDLGYLVVDVDRQAYQRILDMGFRLEVDERLTAELNRPHTMLPGQTTGIPGYPCYRTVEETYATAEAIVTDHPDLATWIDIGNSWEKEQPDGNPGYDLMVLRLTNAAVPGPKPKLFVMTAIHAREYATAELNTRFAEHLVDNYGLDADVTWLLDHHEIHLLLQSNPDGRKKAETGLYWRKNTNEDYCSPTSNLRGADLNRNFEFEWNCCGGSSGVECDETYRGPEAASEPETQAVQNYVRAQFPDQRGEELTDPAPGDATGVFLDIHSYSELVLWPWGFTYAAAPNSTALQTLGRKFAYFNGYEPEQAVGLYPTDGATDDFAYGDLGLAAYTFEIGTAFFQSCTVFESQILPDNLQALLYAAKVARTPYQTPAGPDALQVSVLPGAVSSGEPVQLTATIDDTRYNNSNGAEPTQNVIFAEYYVDLPPWIGDASGSRVPVPLPMAAVDGIFDQPVEEVEAVVDTSGLSAGRHILYVRGRDADRHWGAFSAVFVYVLDPASAAFVEGYVRDAGTNAPLEATVSAGPFEAVTDPATGHYSMMVISDTYDLEATAVEHTGAIVADVGVDNQQTIHQDFYLDPLCPVLVDDVESGNQGWTAQYPWAITAEAAHSPTHSWTESPGSNYASYRNVSLTSPTYDLSGYEDVTLSFWHIYDLEPSWDYGYVEYSTDGGSSWIAAASYTGYDRTTWTREEIPLPALGGQANARIRFRFYSDTNTVADGWHIDDIALAGASAACVPALPPVAEFLAASPVSVGQPLRFTNLVLGNLPLEFRWDFGDGLGASTESDPNYTYPRADTFAVTLWVTNSLGSDSVSHPVVVVGQLLYLPLVTR